MKRVKRFVVFLAAVAMMISVIAPAAYAAFPDGWVEYKYVPGTPDTGIMDFSWLNEMPAGQHGFVQVVDGNFQFEDGTPVRFWGTVCGFNNAFPYKSDAEKIAADLASMGVNFVRIHAIDCIFAGGSCGIVDFSDYGQGLGPKGFIEANLDRMDYFIYCLKEKGIYIHLDTSAGRRITLGEGFDKTEVAASSECNLRGASFFDDRVSKIEYDYAEDFLVKHVNPYTKLSYCNDPAIAVIQRVNESCVFWVDWPGNLDQNGFIIKLTAKFNAWLLEKYGTREALAQAWTNDRGECGLGDDEDPTLGTVLRGQLGNWSEPAVSWAASYDSVQNPARHADWFAFLIELQLKDFSAFSEMLRANGYKGSINCSNYPVGPADLYLESQADVTELNHYFNGTSDSSVSSLSEHNIFYQNHLMQRFVYASCADKAFVSTEWEDGAASDFRGDAFLQVSSYAAFQDLDGFCAWIYGSSYQIWDESRGIQDAKNDPGYFGQMGIAAMIFRLGLVQTAKTEVEYVYTTRDILATTPYQQHLALSTVFAFTSKFALRYIEDEYDGDADLVIASSNLSYGDYSSAKNLIIQSISPYSDPFQKQYARDDWTANYISSDAPEEKFGSKKFKVGQNVLSCEDTVISKVDADMVNGFMRHFGLWDEQTGYVDGKAVSDTGELVYDYTNHYVSCVTDQVCYVTGVIPASAKVGQMSYSVSNDKASIVLLSTDDKKISESEALFFYAIGRSRSKTAIENNYGYKYMGGGKVYYQDVKGVFSFDSEKESCCVWGLDADGNRVEKIKTEKTDTGFKFNVVKYCNYEIRLNYDDSNDPILEPSQESQSSQEQQNSQSSQSGQSGTDQTVPIIVVAAVVVAAAVIAVLVIRGNKKK
ncbi:MAG: hypothetical protein J5874_03795 [Oscillospiraceae bacterium]|nr:hypothetical protein [Oscillospiraceae bacterium]